MFKRDPIKRVLTAASILLPLTAYAALATMETDRPPHLSDNIPDPFTAQTSIPHLSFERTLTMRSGETLVDVLHRAGFNRDQTNDLMASLPSKVKPRHLKAGTEFTLSYSENEPYRISDATFSFRHGPGQLAHLNLTDGKANSRLETRELTNTKSVAVGRIQRSLYQDATDAGVPARLIKPFVDLFAWDIDYTRDVHPGDTFKVVYEETLDDRGERVKTGRILAASFTAKGQTQQAFWFKDTNGRGDYYNEKGESKRKLLLRTPLEVYRISSHFNPNRKHPILGYTRAHKGTDFAAPRGTPVKASGDGTITFAGRNGGYGNFVKIKHNGTYTTAYAHLQKFARGIRSGKRVRQGQIIAYVGTTGASTGPHLHYEVIKKGRHVNAMRTDLPTGTLLAKRSKGAFLAMVANIQKSWDSALTRLAATHTAQPQG